jgi:hypothetical protein
MSRRLVFCLFLLLPAVPVDAATRVTLPDASAYTYWVQGATGTVSAAPVSVTGHNQFTLPSSATSGTLYVLDRHDGQIAAMPLTGQSLTLAVGDFKPFAAPSPTSAPAAPAPTPAAPKPAPAASSGSGIGRLFTLIFGLLIAGGVFWVIRHLIQSRGQPLIDMARRVGVEVPDPVAQAEDQPAPVYTPPAPRAPEPIPEEAGAAPLPVISAPRRAATGTVDGPQIVGVQGLAAGTVFAIPIGDVSIGRDGDNGIVLAENTVSRRHALLSRSEDGRITLADAGSANGVYVNGQRVTETALSPGDQIQVGDNFFRLEA